MSRGWSKARGKAEALAYNLGHRMGNFSKNGVFRTAKCAYCRKFLNMRRVNGRWMGSGGVLEPCEARRFRMIRRLIK